MAREIPIGRTGSAEYFLRGAWVYRKVGVQVYRYDTAPGFVSEWETGAFGPSWRDTQAGRDIIDRFSHQSY
jgi:hypothetical protein